MLIGYGLGVMVYGLYGLREDMQYRPLRRVWSYRLKDTKSESTTQLDWRRLQSLVDALGSDGVDRSELTKLIYACFTHTGCGIMAIKTAEVSMRETVTPTAATICYPPH
jgi:hypothetical protein